ncbi:sugar 3,4-ketoisomerase [Pedobacter helvus]|uniref:Sugar 3,4-ketoisomerase n=1 Tax=Pedobacter helvus TaxID=2563444 RepID=A0ABW9JES5_9SPHI|nr:FdtA/QdtA family cupin domain-containing protein [Pedobacter ureilyticus]
MKSTTVYDCNLISLPKNHYTKGNITAINEGDEIPFSIERVYYLYDVPAGESRGGHGHKELQQLIVAASGSFDLIVNDGRIKRTIHLARPNMGVYMPAGIWREIDNFSSGSICLVLASKTYGEEDYFRDYNEYLKYKGL